MTKKLLTRSEVNVLDTWDLNPLFTSDEEFEIALKEVSQLALDIESTYKDHLDTPDSINACLDQFKVLMEKAYRVATYASLYVSEDQTNSTNVQRQMKVGQAMSVFGSKVSFISSQISQADPEVLVLAKAQSAENAHYLEEILREKPYMLHPEVESVLSSLSPVLGAPYQIYNRAKLADMDFGTFSAHDKEHPLSFVLFENEWEFETDTETRRAAFEAFSKKLKQYQHTISAAYQTQIQKEKIMASLRGFESVIDSLLFDQEVDQNLYNRQIDVIMEKLAPHMRKYAKLLQRIHNLDRMTFADLKLAVDPDFEPEITIEQSKEYILEGLSVLGSEYTDMVKRAYDERWIDFVQNIGKSTGAFCSSPYGIHPFILISWTERMRECFVLAHELGHAGHFFMAQQAQNILNTRPSLYFIEAPSTMNEMLMANHLMKTSQDPRMKRWVLSTMISRTYYHNFVTHLLEAAYQREVYRIIDQGGSVVASTLSKIKKDVLTKFWGDTVEIIDGSELTWMRQPHYYMGLYPYTYSAGLTVATEVSRRLLEDPSAIEDWKNVLRAGGTKSPVELAQMAKVDITTDQPLLNTIKHIGDMIDQIIELTDQIEEA
ncbi:MAG: oligoendopeptidase F [Firmicutes bacterium HGW-Firmicutes-10]|nr:MAG: oligoendopeptidase F [Firmicutes bacterium HGW-Firmicutes-10]